MNIEDKVYNELKNCHHVSLTEILDAREKRVYRQLELLESYEVQVDDKEEVTLICFTMNIAGPVKAFELARSGFESGLKLLGESLEREKYKVLHGEKEIEDTGYTAYYLVEKDALSVKRMTTDIEDNTPLGRLFDIDVLILDSSEVKGNIAKVRKIGRNEIGLEGRKCIICGENVAVCARSRQHGLEDLQKKTIKILLMNI